MSPAPLEAHLGFWLRFVSNHVSQRFQPLLEGEGVTVTDWVALRTLWTNPQTTHAQLIEALGLTSRGSVLGPGSPPWPMPTTPISSATSIPQCGRACSRPCRSW